MRLTWGQLRHLLWEASGGRYYHVSRQDLGDSATLEPYIPSAALDLQEEDFTTPRVCFAPSIKQAIDALAMDPAEYDELHAYAVDSIPDMFTPHGGEFPKGAFATPGHAGRDARAAALKGFVPDAEKSGEVWSLSPIRAVRVKVIKTQGRFVEAAERDCWGGSRPEETYDELLEDDPVYQKKSVMVPDDIKKAISSWSEQMGLSKRVKKRS